MDFWASLCPNISSIQQRRLRQLSRRRRTNTVDPPLLDRAERRSSSAASKRISFSLAGKLTQSLPSSTETGSTTDLYRQYSLEDFAMQNNYAVIGNKVGPVIIRNCAEEYQMDKFFLLKDNFSGFDRHETIEEYGVPNLHVVATKPAIYAIGQPTMNGLQKLTNDLMSKHKLSEQLCWQEIAHQILNRIVKRFLWMSSATMRLCILNFRRRFLIDYVQNLTKAFSKGICYINVRALPTLFLRRSDDFVPYSAYTIKHSDESSSFMNEREIHDAEREMQLQALKIATTKSGLFYYYNVLESSPHEPHMYKTTAMEDLVTSRQLFSKIQSDNSNFKYKRIPLPHCEEPSSERIDALVDVIKEIECHNDSEDIALVFQCLTGEGAARMSALVALLSLEEPHRSMSPPEEFTNRIRFEFVDEEKLMKSILLRLDIYCFLLVFRSYVIDQRPMLFRVSFTHWLENNPKFLFDMSQACSAKQNLLEMESKLPYWELRLHKGEVGEITMDPTFHRVARCPIFGISQTTTERFCKIIEKLCGAHARKKYERLEFINVRDDSVFYHTAAKPKLEEGEIYRSRATDEKETLWELTLNNTLPFMFGANAEVTSVVEERLTSIFSKHPNSLSLSEGGNENKGDSGKWKSTKQMMFDIKNNPKMTELCDDINYTRIPLPKHRIPRFECFDQLISAVRDSVEGGNNSAFVFFCHNGKKRTTNMMVTASLILFHMKKFDIDDAIPSSNHVDFCAPEFTKGEYKVILELVQILPDCNLRKKEVDAALDIVHENMSTMHYHLREHLHPGFEKARRAKTLDKYLLLKHRAYLRLELYAILIIFNCYLYQEKENLWRRISFEKWMSEYASRFGVLDVLNNFGLTELGQDYPMNLMKARWMDSSNLLQKIYSDSPTTRGCQKVRTNRLQECNDDKSFYKAGSTSNLDVICEYGNGL